MALSNKAVLHEQFETGFQGCDTFKVPLGALKGLAFREVLDPGATAPLQDILRIGQHRIGAHLGVRGPGVLEEILSKRNGALDAVQADCNLPWSCSVSVFYHM
jgi:hypothetical protein